MTVQRWRTRQDGTFGPAQHWYFITRYECVLCGRSSELRERRYGRRPERDADRFAYVQHACSEHFL